MTRSLITGKTKVCGLIADPIEHSISPLMHNAAFEKLGLDYVYVPFRVRQEDLHHAISGMRTLNIAGLNVTIPHKVAVMPLLDEVDILAQKVGAVNTIVNDGGVLKGYNTDAAGFLHALRGAGIEPQNKDVVILGAGGAARAIAYILAASNARVVIINRNLERARELVHEISEASSRELRFLRLEETSFIQTLKKCDILVNATSVGMSPEVDETPVPARLLRPGMVVFDIVYNPVRTRLLKEAKSAGARTISGIEMLVGQGALAFEKWTGKPAPVAVMRQAALKALQHED